MSRRYFASGEWLKHVLILAVAAVSYVPLYVMFLTAFKSNRDFLANPLGWPQSLEFSNWIVGWEVVKDLLATTGVVAVTAVVFKLAVALPGAYFFARGNPPFKNVLWFLFMSLLMMPSVANLLPLYILLKDLGMLNSIWTISLIITAGGQVGTIFWLRGFVEDIPKDLFEAAEVDGASHYFQMTRIVLPLCGPILGTLAITGFIGAWNEFMLPLIIITDPWKQMLSVGLMQLESQYIKQYGQLMSAYAIASLPLIVLFLFTMRLFVKGLMGGAVKG